MLSIFKKKDNVFSCLGVIVQEKMSDEDFKSCLNFFKKALKPKIFTSDNLETISKKLGFNVREYYFFIDNQDLKKKEYNMMISILYRFEGSKSISEDEVEALLRNIDSELFYTRVDIEKLSRKYGFSIFDRCQFEPYTITTFTLKKGERTISFIVPKAESIN
jgi:hypothetical protein